MANTYVDYTATAAQTDFAFNFNYLEDSHVVVEIDGIDKTLTTDYTIVTSPEKKVVLTSGATAGQLVRVKRVSDFGTDLVNFVNGSVLNEADLDKAYQHNRYLNEEAAEGNNDSMQTVGGGTDFNAENKKIVNLATPTATTDATNKNYVDTQVALSATNLSGFESSSHTGDNTAVDFTLSFTPQISTPEAFLVTIDGVVQKPTTAYTIDPATPKITFTSAPPTSAVINVVAIAQSSASADTTTVKATGSTTSRSLADRFADITNVLDYGTDSNAVQAAVNAAGVGGTVLFPAGTYTITTKINVNNRQILLGEKNAEINCGTAGITMFERNGPLDGSAGSLCFRNLRFLGEGTRSSKAIFVSPNTPHVLIDNCYFADFSEAVHLEGSYMSRIESCSFSNNYKGLHLEGNCHASGVHSSIFHNPSIRGGATKSYGIAINGDEVGQDSGAASLHNIVIANTALQNSDYGCWAEKCENISFENIYHEGNYTADIQLGVDDGGTNVRNVFGAVLDSVETNSPATNRATNKGCINLEHVFRPRIRNVLFATGIPTSGSLLYLDGYTRFAEIQISEISGSYTGTQQDAIFMNGDSKFRTKVIENEVEMFTNSKGGEFHGVGWRSEASSNTSGDFNIYHDQPSGRNALNIKAATGSGNFDIKHYSGTSGQIQNYIGTSLLTVTEASAFRPGSDGVTNLGASNKKWNVAYANEVNLGGGGRIITGTGSPEGVINTNPGAIYINLSGGTGTTLYVKEQGVGLNTGWVAK